MIMVLITMIIVMMIGFDDVHNKGFPMKLILSKLLPLTCSSSCAINHTYLHNETKFPKD